MIVVDVETSGINARKHSILSIGAIDFENIQNQFYGECRVWDGAHIMIDSDGEFMPVTEFNGMTEEQMRDQNKQSEKELLLKFKDWMQTCTDYIIAGHNPSFDMEFINEGIIRGHINWSLPRRTLDLHSICYAHMRRKGTMPPVKDKKSFLSSDKVMEFVGLPNEPRPHNALNGALWETEAFHRILFDKQLLDQFKQYPIPWKHIA